MNEVEEDQVEQDIEILGEKGEGIRKIGEDLLETTIDNDRDVDLVANLKVQVVDLQVKMMDMETRAEKSRARKKYLENALNTHYYH